MTAYRWIGLVVLVVLGGGCDSPPTHKDEPAREEPQNKITPVTKVEPVKEDKGDQVDPVPSTEGGLKYEDVRVGTGPGAKKGDPVVVHYTGWLASNRQVFDTSMGKTAFRFVLGRGQVIKGWDEGVVGMKAGGKRLLTIPASLGYGEKGAPPRIPPNADLLFEVEMVRILH
jgi:FKBP-type peptidyl-prolyl cis-trans isomerase